MREGELKQHLRLIDFIRGNLFALQQTLEEAAKVETQNTVSGNRLAKAASDLFRARAAVDEAEDMLLRISGVRGG